MRRKSKDLKILALSALRGNYMIPILASLTINILVGMLTTLSTYLFGGTSLFAVLADHAFSFILSLILTVFTAGLNLIFLNIARKQPYSFSNLTAMFSRKPDRIIIAGFFLTLINLITSFPYYIILYRMPEQLTIEELAEYSLPLLLTLELSVLLDFLITLPLCQVYLLLIDYPDLEAMAAFRESARLMKGNKGRYIFLRLSFLPLVFLSVLTCGIALIWVTPYIQMANTMFYLDITGELDAVRENPPMDSPYPQDDYNAEA